jgi:hypothetical protein
MKTPSSIVTRLVAILICTTTWQIAKPPATRLPIAFKGTVNAIAHALVGFVFFLLTSCTYNSISPTAEVVNVVGDSTTALNVGASRSFSALVINAANQAVTWSVVEPNGGVISSDGIYTAPSLPGRFTIKATAQNMHTAFGTLRVPVVIPEGHIPGYDVGVDFHSTTSDFINSAFITQYNIAAVRQTVITQLQGMADRGASIISTRIWFVNEPNSPNDPNIAPWRATFPMTDLEQTNLHNYAQDVAKIVGSGGNRLRLSLCALWLGAADYTRGDPVNGLGYTPLPGAEFTSRVETTTNKMLAAITGVVRPDGVPVVDIVYMEGEVMIGAKANQGWFLTTHYPRFYSKVLAAGFEPAMYFLASVFSYDQPLVPGYVDVDFPILNGHRTMFWIYRSLKFMVDNNLPIPKRIDFSCYPDPGSGQMGLIITKALDDADATLPSLGALKSYGAVETFYFPDDNSRKILGQAFATEAAKNSRLQRVSFWTSPDGGGSGVDVAYPFKIEDYLPPQH